MLVKLSNAFGRGSIEWPNDGGVGKFVVLLWLFKYLTVRRILNVNNLSLITLVTKFIKETCVVQNLKNGGEHR